MLGDLEELRDRTEPRAPGQGGRDLVARDAADGGDLDLPGRQRVAASHFDPGLLPDANAAGDLATPDERSKSCGELHVCALFPEMPCPGAKRIGYGKIGIGAGAEKVWNVKKASDNKKYPASIA